MRNQSLIYNIDIIVLVLIENGRFVFKANDHR